MWTPDKVLALAPDPASAKAGQGLSSPRKWVSSGGNDRAFWGECQGSGAKPYQTQIDLSEPAFKCSCPSRKFPCKHALGLMLMLGAGGPANAAAPPQWVTDWLASRDEKSAKKQERVEKAVEAPADPAAQAERLETRLKKIAAGAEDLTLWLQDLVRQGLAHAQGAGEKFWSEPAARMVDAQAPGLARMVRDIGESVSSGSGWQERALRRSGRLFLLLEALRRLDTLPPDLQTDVRTFLGIPIREEDLAALPAVKDTWSVVGQRQEADDKLRTQRTWLRGNATGRHALILEFAFGGQPLKSTLMLGSRFEGEVVFYPGAAALRASIRSRIANLPELPSVGGVPNIHDALVAWSDALATCPFLERFPFTLSDVRITQKKGLFAVDSDGRMLPLSPRPGRRWDLLAITGGHPVTLFGEFDGQSLFPMAVLAEERIHGIC